MKIKKKNNLFILIFQKQVVKPKMNNDNLVSIVQKLNNIRIYKQIQKSRMFKKRVVKQQQILNLNNDTQQQSNNKQSPQITNKPFKSPQANSKQQKQSKPQYQEQQVYDRQQPQKKVKPDYPSNLIASSTTQNKQKKQAQLHKQFKSLNYSASQDPSSQNKQNSFSNQQLLLEQQLAKQKYLHNVSITQQVKEGRIDTEVYRGTNSYANYALTEDEIVNAEEKFRKRQGPSRLNNTIRNTCRFDYNFGLCKDWHDSGYCPFGDSCIYLHDRSNYKTGWEQERDFQRTEKERWRRISNPDLAAKEDLQEALKSIEKHKPNESCSKCKKEMKTPVEVQCGHIYCSPCAITLSKCVECKKTLSGIMNNAQKKIKKMKSNYEELKAKILKEQEQNKMKRTKYNEVDSQNVFAE